MLAADARKRSHINATAIKTREFESLKDQLDTCINAAVADGQFQTTVRTNSPRPIVDELVALLVAGKFDVDVGPAIDMSYANRDAADRWAIWIGWADDQCKANRALNGHVAVKPKRKSKAKRQGKRVASKAKSQTVTA